MLLPPLGGGRMAVKKKVTIIITLMFAIVLSACGKEIYEITSKEKVDNVHYENEMTLHKKVQ